MRSGRRFATAGVVGGGRGLGAADSVVGTRYHPHVIEARQTLFVLLAGVLAASGLCAQQFVRATPIGHDEFATAVGFADLNGDGATDLLLNGDGNGALAIRLTDQNARFGPRIELRDPASNSEVAFAAGDIDGDGDSDIVVGVAAVERIHVYRNDGPLGFVDVSQAQMPSQPVAVSRLDLLDVDGDGDLDLHAARHGTDRLYINDGAGGFTDQTATRIPWRSALEQFFDVATGDVDGDGDVDLVIATDSGPSLRLNDGTGVYTDVAAPASATEVLAVEVADFDGDGIADLYYGTFVNPPSSPIGPAVDELWLGTGAGGFVLAPVIGGGFVTANRGTTVTDLNGDVWPDLVIGAQEGTFVRFGSAAGLLPGVELLDRAGNSTSDWWPLAADLDADGDTDVVAWWRWFRNDGTGQFVDATDPRMFGAGAGAAIDVDLDGNLDLVGTNTLAINDGNGRFPVLYQLPAEILAMGDVDGDGDLDPSAMTSRISRC